MEEEPSIEGLISLLKSMQADPILIRLTVKVKKKGMPRERFIPWINGAISFAHTILGVNDANIAQATMTAALCLFDETKSDDSSNIPPPTNVDEFLKSLF